jgi:hypothetical protein
MNTVKITQPEPAQQHIARFFHFSQNNSGGISHNNNNVSHHVIIEANSPKHANQLAIEIGIYFNGCQTGSDCECCGDRWSEQWGHEKGDTSPLIYGMILEKYEEYFTQEGEVFCHVYYLDGSKATYSKG